MSSLRLEGELTVSTAAALRERLRDLIESEGELEVELSDVIAIDTAGLQLLLAVRREAARVRRRLRFVEPSACVMEALVRVNLSALIVGPSEGAEV